MSILRLSTLSLASALVVFALGDFNPASAAKKEKNCDGPEPHPSCPQDEPDPDPPSTVTYTAELKGAFAFDFLNVTLEGQDERLRNGDPVDIVRPDTGDELTTWNLVFNVCGLLHPVPEFTAPAGKKGWRIARPGGVYVLFRNVGPLPSTLGEGLEVGLQLIGDCSYSSAGTTDCDPFPPVPGEDYGHGDGVSEIPLTHFNIHADGEKGITHSIEGCHSESDDLLVDSTLVITAIAP